MNRKDPVTQVLDLITSQWTPETPSKFVTLCANVKSTEIYPLYVLVVLLQIPGCNHIAFNELCKKVCHPIKKLSSLPKEILLDFWNSVTGYITKKSILKKYLTQFTPVLKFDDSTQILPIIITLRNVYLLHEYLSLLNFDDLNNAAAKLISSKDTELVCQIYPFIVSKRPNLIVNCFEPRFKPAVLSVCLFSNQIGKISQENFARCLFLLKNGSIQPDSELYYAICYYAKRYFVPDLDLNNKSIQYVTEIIESSMPTIKRERIMMKETNKLVDEAKDIINHHIVDQIEPFAEKMMNKGDDEKFIAAATISALIITYPVDKNIIIKLILLLKELKLIVFPMHLAGKLLRQDPNFIEKLKLQSPVFAVLNAVLKGSFVSKLHINVNKPRQILKGLYVAATSDYCRKNDIKLSQEFSAFLFGLDLSKCKKAPKLISNGVKSSIWNDFDFNSKNAVQFYNEILKSKEELSTFKSKIFSEKLDTLFAPTPDETVNNEQFEVDNLTLTIVGGMNLPSRFDMENDDDDDNEFDQSLFNSGYHSRDLMSTLNDDDDDDIDCSSLYISVTGIS
ncbi:hypothetical protein TRFO_38587 [Tritrichomonas foetus]|uniref:Uncharacterized protein n=1 Tax=Tritrichomonas foetus TaxID=1144522 RepID=A0A1J4JD32_9EUKA|nr:hypothetical protein TRFO_38587 [Tritrichomonas foetus]|eukprot:OHS95317.1 hypothetical protein TRFO_38587 [Tritrichomonas foetus]